MTQVIRSEALESARRLRLAAESHDRALRASEEAHGTVHQENYRLIAEDFLKLAAASILELQEEAKSLTLNK